MAYVTDANFDSRSKRIIKNAKLAKRGRVHSINHDGLIVSRPRRARVGLPLRGLMRIVVALWVFKVLAVLNLGVSDYASRIDLLAQGNVVERMATTVMQADAVTLFFVEQVHGLVKMAGFLERAAIF